MVMVPQAVMISEAHMSPQAGIVLLQADVISQADLFLQADTRTRLARPCFYLFSMRPQADMSSEAHMSPQVDIDILQADVISQAGNILQAHTRTRLTHPCFFALP